MPRIEVRVGAYSHIIPRNHVNEHWTQWPRVPYPADASRVCQCAAHVDASAHVVVHRPQHAA